MKYLHTMGALLCAATLSVSVQAADLEVKITRGMDYTTVTHDGELVKIMRNQDTDHSIEGPFARTSRPCPPFCINPISLQEDVRTVAELEVINFMDGPYYRGRGVIVDTRTPSWHRRGTIPGSVNIPFAVFEKPEQDTELAAALEALGGKQRGEVGVITRAIEQFGFMDGDLKTEKWDFSDAKDVLLWCNGPWCGQTPRAIRGLLKVGYPAEKLFYYRGGMQMWQLLGLTTVRPGTNTLAAREAGE